MRQSPDGPGSLGTRRGVLAATAAAAAAPAPATADPPDAEAQIRQVVDRYARLWAAGDPRAFDCYHDDFVLHYQGANALAGDHVGKAACIRTLGELGRRTANQLVAVTATLSGPERGAIVARMRLRDGDRTVEMDRVLVYTVRDGRLFECWQYNADQALVDRLVGPS